MSSRLRAAFTAGLATACLAVSLCGASAAGARTPADFYGVVSQTPVGVGDLQRMDVAHVGSLRFTMLWSNIQSYSHGSYSYNWGPTDFVIDAAARAGVPLHPVLIGTPMFAAGCDDRACQVRVPVHSAEQRAAWSAFVKAAVARYMPGGTYWQEPLHLPITGYPQNPITEWQIWNEENNGHVGATPAQYSKLVKLAHAAMSSSDPSSSLVLGGLAGNITPGHEHRAAWDYLNAIYHRTPKSSFDAVALHPYAEAAAGIKPQIKKMRTVMAKHGDRSTPLNITEIGWGSGKPRVDHAFVETRRGQKRRLVRSFNLLRKNRARWNIGAINWFAWKDPPPGQGLCGFCYSSGLLDHHSHPKPSFSAFIRFTGGS